MSRIEAWNFMKKLNDGTANLVVRHKIINATPDTQSEKASEVATPSVASSKKSDLSPTSSAAASAAAEQQLIEKTKLEAKR